MELTNIEKFISDIEQKERECNCVSSEGLVSETSDEINSCLNVDNNECKENVCCDELSLLNDENILITHVIGQTHSQDHENVRDPSIASAGIETVIPNLSQVMELCVKDCNHVPTQKSSKLKHVKKSKKNLDDIYNTIVQQKLNEQPEHTHKPVQDNYDLNYLLNNPEMINNQNALFDALSTFTTKYLYEESTRGWNQKYDILILNQHILNANIQKIKWYSSHNALKIGYIYRNINDPKIFADKNINTHWLMCGIDTSKSIISTFEIKELKPSDKILKYSLENLVTNKKYKKKIGSTMYKFIKIQSQFSTNRNMIMDVIFYIGLKKGVLYK